MSKLLKVLERVKKQKRCVFVCVCFWIQVQPAYKDITSVLTFYRPTYFLIAFYTLETELASFEMHVRIFLLTGLFGVLMSVSSCFV